MKLWKFLLLLIISLSAITYGLFHPGKAEQNQEVHTETPILNFVSGTEYKPGQEGQVIVEARYRNGTSAINSTNCFASVWYPDKSIFINNTMMNLSDSNGNAFINFTIPDTDGVYEYQSTCTVGFNDITASHSFHVTKLKISAVVTK